MNRSSDVGVGSKVERAESARARLLENLEQISKAGERMIEKSGRIGKNVLLGVGFLGILGIGALLMRKRRPGPFRLRGQRPERSFLSEALRSVVLSTLGVLAARAAQRIPLPEAGSGDAE